MAFYSFHHLNKLTYYYTCLVNVLDYFVIGADKTAAVDEPTDTGAEMTEEEWNLRVAELNKHQVCL